jgi:hypothetical protein
MTDMLYHMIEFCRPCNQSFDAVLDLALLMLYGVLEPSSLNFCVGMLVLRLSKKEGIRDGP